MKWKWLYLETDKKDIILCLLCEGEPKYPPIAVVSRLNNGSWYYTIKVNSPLQYINGNEPTKECAMGKVEQLCLIHFSS